MSTNHSTAGEIAIAEDSLRIWSCVTCRRRKVKCDRKDPCSNCVKNQIECHFPVTGRLPRRRDPAAWKSPTEKQAELLDRLRRLESLVTELAAQVEDGPDKIQSLFTGPMTSATGVIHSGETVNAAVGKRGPRDLESPMAVGELISAMKSSFQGEINEDFGRLVVGKEAGLQIGKGFWSIFCNEVEHIFQAIQDVTSDKSGSNLEATSSNSQRQSNSIYSEFYLGNQYTRDVPQSLDALYPLPSQMLFIWRTYLENIVPFINVIDIAAVEEVVTNLRGKFDFLEPSLQALLFAVSLAAITSLHEEEDLACFDTPRIELIARFRLGTERALANAELLTTRKIETIQAFVIYLSLLPYIGGQELLSPFMGLLLRIATSLQLHRDAENFKIPTLTKVEIEIRRRLWWQIIFLDSKSRSKRTAGLSASDTMFDTKSPSHMLEDEEAQDKVKVSPSWNKLNKLIIAAEAHRGRNPAEGTLRVRPQNKPYTASFINTEENVSGASEASVTQSANTHIPLDYPESNQAAFDNRSEIDESNKFESAMAFYPMEWRPWDEGLATDNEFWDFDFANVEESLEL
ncbi:fungal zn(2)-Cys(6) binuclear cluster domain-containing protein [Trichoderma breve]|uniref:Fungal zn(2)-Cys(6) binuclear cluster domain-containing protein n=1 Tax=Trichoderma breve TaxID=2034170 RepID=A0A9W9BDK3_9HYPO|nr:fungal zn(2)-Cys(6) binuclear cluster domain-containing protein [Trichoderma breve]KAJ4861312.1 fungal zn(2)-Cys(6) binuclear cluster domain-containing protein [Trichoderma breve]